MARIELRDVAKRWGEVVAVEPDRPRDRGRRVRGDARAVGLRQVDDAVHARRHLPAERRRDPASTATVVNEVEARDRNVGIVFQSYALYPHMTVRDNIRFPLRFKKTPRDEAIAPRARRPPTSCRSASCSTGGRASSRAASSSGWRSPARWSRSRSSCCSTSRSRTSTPRSGSPCAARSVAAAAARA